MKKYCVQMPFTGVATVEVEAENKEDALDQAWEVLGDLEDDDFLEAIEDLRYHEEICRGNVFNGCQNEVCIIEIK